MVLPAVSMFTNAKLEWDEFERPRSLLYGDIYFSSADALGESTHVFLQGNRLAERWRQLQAAEFSIGELGFGSGLNFLNTCRLWCEEAPVSATLHYIACELHPLVAADMRHLHAQWPELERFSTELLACYPDHTAGIHQLELRLGEHKVCLSLLYGEAQEMLQSIWQAQGCRVDAWYLDGFAPRLNPALWQDTLLQLLARLGKPGSTLATYSVAGAFRQSLAAAGFSFAKTPGYANKRHMLQAQLPLAAKEASDSVYRETSGTEKGTVCVIGAGLAGCSTAHRLAQSGWQVLLLERESTLATRGSGNPQAILHCKPGKVNTAVNQFNIHAYLHAGHTYSLLASTERLGWHPCGMLQLGVSAELQQRYRQIAEGGLYAEQILRYLDAREASLLAGVELHDPALHFPASGWLSPPELCALYTRHSAIELMTSAEVVALDETELGWRINMQTPQGFSTRTVDKVVLCNAADVHSFQQTRHYPVISNRGQVDVYPATPATQVQLALCGQGYILPAQHQQLCVGGSYFVGDQSPAAMQQRRELHLRQVQQLNAGLAAGLSAQTPLLQRLGTRCIMPDRMPLVGQACRPAHEGGAPYPGLFLNAAHGSHGLTRTPLSAAYLASLLNRTVPPIPADLSALLQPQRFHA